MSRGAALVAVLGVALGVRLANVRWMAAQPITDFQYVWGDSDMAMHWQWAGRIVGGDLLSREPYPLPPWMQAIAPFETWQRWHGGNVFFKAPLYPYALAALRAAVGDDRWKITLGHVAVGVVNVALVFLLAARYFDGAVALVAGLAAALYGPALLYEALLLRDSLGVTVSLLLLLALARCTTVAPGPWLVAGLAFAVALLGRELVAPFGLCVAFWIWQRFRRRPAEMIRVLGAFVLGAGLGLTPLVARNLAVGVSPLALSAIGPEGLLYGHAADSAPAQLNVPNAAAEVLRTADGSLLAVLRGTLATYGGDWGRLLRNEGARAAAIFSALEGSDNANWYFYAARSALLGHALHWEIVLAFGLVGLWMARRCVRGDDRIVLYYLGVSLIGLQFTSVVGRYRLVPAAVLSIYAAVTVVGIVRALGARQWRAVVGPAVASACIYVASSRLLLVPGVGERCRSTEYLIAAQVAATRGDGGDMYEALNGCLDCLVAHANATVLPPTFEYFARDFLVVAARLGRTADATAAVERLQAAYPADPVLPQLLARARPPESVPSTTP
jgi:hypothetical protein